jgi:hypothetical protein
MTLRVPTSPRTTVRPPLTRLATLGALAGAVASLACAPSAGERGSVPAASLLVSAGDSTFWIESDSGGLRVRRSAILLTELDGRLHELYLADDDRSFYDAVILGQNIFRRDLAAGDSVLLATDSVLAGLAREYAARHPQEPPLAPDEEAAAEPSIHATTDTELLDAMGPFLVFEQHVDIDRGRSRDVHLTRRGVLDVRDGRQVTVADLVGERQAGEIFRQAQALLAAAIDSIRRANDERARRAATALAGFALDSSSFALVEEDGEPAIAFLVPGRGPRAGGYALPLAPLRITAGPWWGAVRPALLTSAGDRLAWQGGGLELVAREDSTGESATVALRLAAGEWPLGRFPLPLRRVYRLDPASASPETIAALRRAFDEAAIYSGEVRTAMAPAVGAPHTRPDPWGRNRYVLPLDARASSGVLAGGAASPASRLACLALWRPA